MRVCINFYWHRSMNLRVYIRHILFGDEFYVLYLACDSDLVSNNVVYFLVLLLLRMWCECAGLPGPPGPAGWAQKGDKGETGSSVSNSL